MKSHRRHLLLATTALLALSTCRVRASSAAAASASKNGIHNSIWAAGTSAAAAAAGSASKNGGRRGPIVGGDRDRRDPLRRRARFGLSGSRRALMSNEIASAFSALERLRGGSDGPDEDERKDDEIDSAAAGASSDELPETSGWGAGLFGKKKPATTTTTADDDDESEKEENGTFEITMNASPDGKTNARVDIKTPEAVQRMAKETLSRMEEALPEQQRGGKLSGSGSVAYQAVIGGSQTAATAHISSKFPISPAELPHFLSMSVLMFLFIYVFTTVRDTKDTLVVSNCGAEAIPFLKLYGVMPCATAFIVVYSRLSNALGKQALFYTTLIPFFVFYGVFAFVLFPNRDVLHFPLAEGAAGAGGAAMNLLRYWSFSLFFVVSELWGSAGVPLLFWQCANDVTPMAQAKRFYPLFAITGNLAPIVSGKVMSYVISLQKTSDDVGFGSTLKILAVVKAAIGLGIIAIYRKVYAMAEERKLKERTEQSLSTIRGIEKTGKVEITMEFKKPKKKLTLKESAKELMASPELRAMATMVFCYNACVELTEVLWKAILRRTYPTKSAYMDYMARFSQTVGLVAFFLQLVASEIMTVFGWRWTAMIPPVTMGVLAVAFFAALVAGEERIPLAQALLIGTVQNVANKVTKYSLFDPCKEMAYIPLGPDAKVKGKAAVDVLGARLGRSAGSATQQLLVFLVGAGSILNCVPYVGACYVAAVVTWSNAVGVLGRLFDGSNADGGKIGRAENERKLAQIGEAITIIKSIEDAKREKKGKQGGSKKKKDGK